ncbi:MAG TPA: phosphoribosylaminoimidazolesuccinocarboxamide synthase [Gammaproteobacteria bacterium]|nr:phosphoribosylaminoimidazolesuccinocarboxamide synthase [Gammaproteobacteria bacterium]
MPETLIKAELKSLPLVHRGKVRDIFAVGDDHLLIVATDRLSAFDVILPDPIPDKGRVLTGLARFWFGRTRHIVPNHVADIPLEDAVPDADDRRLVEGRATVVRKLSPLPIEAIARGYLIGSGWKDYQANGTLCGLPLPAGLRQADRLPEPLFTPSSKAAPGQHDENINFREVERMVGPVIAAQVRDATLALYEFGALHAAERGVIIADTKFEFGLDDNGKLVLIDEALTPDSSRFWPAASYRSGISPPSFDKQFVRDYLETLDWNKTAPGPTLPVEIIEKTAEKYREAYRLLTG